MADSCRHLALDNLVTALSNISVLNGYATDVTEVAMRAFEWETVYQDYSLPVIGVVPNAVTYEYLSKNVIQGRQAVAVEFCYSAPTQELAWSVGDALIDDIIGAIHVDPTRGGYAMHTTIQSAETDAGNPDIIDSRGGTAAGIVQLEIVLTRGWVVTP